MENTIGNGRVLIIWENIPAEEISFFLVDDVDDGQFSLLLACHAKFIRLSSPGQNDGSVGWLNAMLAGPWKGCHISGLEPMVISPGGTVTIIRTGIWG